MYTNVITVANAKDYLGIDDDSRDAEIKRMINSALKYLEKRTNIIMVAIDKSYVLTNGCAHVYDYPINTPDADLDDTVTRTNGNLYSVYSDTATDATVITLNVGCVDVDEDIIEAGYMLIEHYFQEGDRSAIPKAVEDIIAINKRFII